MIVAFAVTVLLLKVTLTLGVKIDLINCGVDHETTVLTGEVEITDYPWLGILYYINEGEAGELRAVTTVALIHSMFVIGAAADIGPMPKHDFRLNSRVLLGERWSGDERRVHSYVLHPEYEETSNTVALVQLKDDVLPDNYLKIKPLCPPPDFLRNPKFYVMKFKDDFNNLTKEVIPALHIPGELCRDFYVAAKLYARKMRPPHVACVTSADVSHMCVWEAGSALVSRDVWGRWMLLGVGARGPGCGAPARFLDMMSYYPWIEHSLEKFSRITISQIHKKKYVLRSSEDMNKSMQRFGACDPEEKKNLIYRELIILKTDNNQYQFLTYNLTILDNVEYTCLTLELVNASAVSEMRVKHVCPRKENREACHFYKGSTFDISVYMMFSEGCRFEMFAWGFKRQMNLLDIQEWKWEEGTYYDDFTLTPVEYKGTQEQTGFGFEPVDERLWVPDYDIWATTLTPETTTEFPPYNFNNSEEKPVEDAAAVNSTVTPKPIKDQTSPEDEFNFGLLGN